MDNVKKIAIQGGQASFHDKAARLYFAHSQVETVACMSFRQLCEALRLGACDYALMAIENAVAGTLTTNFSLLKEYKFSISGELWLPIVQNLLALPGQKLQDIHTVMSHPVAILQCGNFLKQHPHLQPQEANDTAESAREIREQLLNGVAAIASKQAATCYGLEVLEENIADLKDNYTRFLVLSKNDVEIPAGANKATLILELPNLSSPVSAITNQLQRLNIHTTLVQSIPAPISSEAHYAVLDIVCEEYTHLQSAMEAIRPLVKSLELKGVYQKAAHPLEKEYITSPLI